ncbi:Ldh family oxidoreductase [Comamonas thiooxydans]|uniref:Hydroxyacid dehydrogenase n=1 Tax=Comamonas thiooxydans TaxID=363952 RepID=A0A0E3BVE0_9BURK|nr:Ldh family oxidoreductase [Comamonas thiooxydans]KGG83657.1 hydroxyacid dehydrogenase [Comamonas thiooxydans]MDH1475235.1 Ldh family oxidoreductase [Comamonas thiooxydans]
MTTLDKTIIAEAELRTLGLRAFESLGLPAEDAADVVQVLLLADLFGLSTHGLSRVESYGERLDVNGIAKAPHIKAERVAPAMAKVDGANGIGPLVGMHGLRIAMELARENGIGAAFVRGSNHFGPISPYSYLAAEQGFASMIGSNATTTIAPWGGSDARLGNSPLGFGVPGANGAHFMLDMAMSVVARAKIRNALKAGQSIPDTWATDSSGRATTDPKAALDGFLLPIGGHKGYGLALLVDLFAGLLSDAAYLTHVQSWVDAPDEPQNLGHFFLLIDTRRLGNAAWLVERMADFASILHGSAPAEQGKPVIVPGEIELRNMARQRANGIAMDSATLTLLRERSGL